MSYSVSWCVRPRIHFTPEIPLIFYYIVYCTNLNVHVNVTAIVTYCSVHEIKEEIIHLKSSVLIRVVGWAARDFQILKWATAL